MRSIVYNKNKYTAINCVLLLFFSLAFRLVPKILLAYDIYVTEILFKTASVLLFAAVLYIIVRRLAVGYVYSIDERNGTGELDFSVLRLRGERVSGRECVLSLSSLVLCISPRSRGEIADVKKKYADRNFAMYDYTVSSRGDFLLLVFEDGYEYSALLIEPDDAMRKYLLSIVPYETM